MTLTSFRVRGSALDANGSNPVTVLELSRVNSDDTWNIEVEAKFYFEIFDHNNGYGGGITRGQFEKIIPYILFHAADDSMVTDTGTENSLVEHVGILCDTLFQGNNDVIKETISFEEFKDLIVTIAQTTTSVGGAGIGTRNSSDY